MSNFVQGLFGRLSDPATGALVGFVDQKGREQLFPFYDATSGTLLSGAGAFALPLPANALEVRGDSLTFGAGLPSQASTYGARASVALGIPYTNHGLNSTGVLTQWLVMTSGQRRPTQTAGLATFWLVGFNDMRAGDSAARLSAYRGTLGASLLLVMSKFSALRQFYNGGGGTFFGAPAGSFVQAGTWNISPYGQSGSGTDAWRGVVSYTNGDTVTAKVQGSVVYVVYDRQKNNTGGTFSVSIDGVIVDSTVSCNGAALGLETTDSTIANSGDSGYPTLLRLVTTPGLHSVVITVTSATSTTNVVQIECLAGNDDAIGSSQTLIGGTPRMNAIGYAASDGAYASLVLGDAAVAKYQQIEMDIVAQFAADGFRVAYADTSALDATVAANVQSDNIHYTDAGQILITTAFLAGFSGVRTSKARGASGDIQTLTTPASGAVYQNRTQVSVEAFITGGVISAVDFSRDGGLSFISAATSTPTRLMLSPLDALRVTYSAAPAINLVPR